MPEGWAWCRLGEICEVSSAKRVLQQDWKTSGIPFYRAREIAQLSNNEIVKDDLFITPELYNELKQKYGVPISGDLMVSAVGTIGKVYIVKDTDCFYYKDASVICFSKKEKSIDSLYLKLCCESDFLQEQMYSQSKGTTVDTITINKAQNYLFPLPPIFEQQKIVHSIQDFFGHIGILEQNKSELQFLINAAKSKILDLAIHGKLVPQNPNDEPVEELLKRIATSDNRPYKKFEEAVLFEIPKSWSWCYLHTISALLNGDRGENYPSKKDYVECGIPFINAGCLDNGNINYDVANYITEEKYNSLRAGKIQKGDILYCLRGSLGKTGFVITDNKGAISSSLCIFRLNESVIPQYFLYVLNSNAIKVQQKMVDNGTAQPNLSAKDVSNYQIPLPPLAEQYRIVTKIEELFEKLDIISN